MRSYVRIPRIVTVQDLERERQRFDSFAQVDKAEPEPEILTPRQQWALIELRGNALARIIIEKLKHSTVMAPTTADYEALVPHGFARPVAWGRKFEMTPHGLWKSTQIMLALGKELNISPADLYRPNRRTRVFAQNANW